MSVRISISIAMATYNGAKYIQQQLDSFLSQNRQPDELVVCDDGSTDGTLDVLEKFRNHAPFSVQIYRNEINLGYVKNFEKALSLSTGDVIFLSDQDDIWHSDKIATMVNLLQNNPGVFVLQADMFLGNEDAEPTQYTQLRNILALGHGLEGYFTGCGTAIRKEWLNVVLPIPAEIVSHDNWIHRLAIAIQVRSVHEAALQCYRRHGSNASNWLASKPRKISAIDSFLSHGMQDATRGWQDELKRIRATRDRLHERIDIVNAMGIGEKLPQALEALQCHALALENRITNATRPRQFRALHVIWMWLHGDYRYFTGWKSMLKDIVRP